MKKRWRRRRRRGLEKANGTNKASTCSCDDTCRLRRPISIYCTLNIIIIKRKTTTTTALRCRPRARARASSPTHCEDTIRNIVNYRRRARERDPRTSPGSPRSLGSDCTDVVRGLTLKTEAGLALSLFERWAGREIRLLLELTRE